MNSVQNEKLLDQIIEESSEIIQAAVKCKRFGINETYQNVRNGEHLAMEIGNLCALLEIGTKTQKIFNEKEIIVGFDAKMTKLKYYGEIEIHERRT